jgi:hypothetical protein
MKFSIRETMPVTVILALAVEENLDLNFEIWAGVLELNNGELETL